MRSRARSWRASSSASRAESASKAQLTVVTAVEKPKFLPPIPVETSLILKYLVDYLLKHKLHKNELFLLEGKAYETRSLLKIIKQGDLPPKLSSYSSRSISIVVRHLLQDCYAPLLPYTKFQDVVANLKASRSPARASWQGVRSIVDTMAPERRGLFESILLLLYKLALKSDVQGVSSVLTATGEALGALLARPSEEVQELLGTMSIRLRIAAFLIENAPELLRKQDNTGIETQGTTVGTQEKTTSKEQDLHQRASEQPKVDHSDSEAYEALQRHSQDRADDEPLPRTLPTRRSSLQTSSASVNNLIQSPSGRNSLTAGSALLTSAKEMIQRLSPTKTKKISSKLRSPTLAASPPPPIFPEGPVVPVPQTRSPLSPSDVVMLRRLLTVIIESPQSKKGLFVEHPSRSDDEARVLSQLMRFHAGKNLNFLPLESFSVLTLALFARDSISRSHVEPLLGFHTPELMEGSAESDLRDMVRSTLENLDEPRKELLQLMLECMQLALVSGTDQYEVEDAIVRCLTGGGSQVLEDDQESSISASETRSLKAILFKEMQHLLSRPGDPSDFQTEEQQTQRNLNISTISSVANENPVSNAPFLAVYWASKCLLRVRHRKLVQYLPEPPSRWRGAYAVRRPMDDIFASELCLMIAFLVTAARDERSIQPVIDLFLTSVDDEQGEQLLVEKMCRHEPLELAQSSPHSLASAFKQVLTTVFEPLVPFKSLYHPVVVADIPHVVAVATSRSDTLDVESELNIWRFEALVMKELAPPKRKLVQAMFKYLDLASSLLRSSNNLRSGGSRNPLVELYEVFGEMLFHPPVESRALAGDFCARARQARLLVDSKQSRTRSSESRRRSYKAARQESAGPTHLLANLHESFSVEESSEIEVHSHDLPGHTQETSGGRLDVAIDGQTQMLDLRLPPATLSEFLCVRRRFLELRLDTIAIEDAVKWLELAGSEAHKHGVHVLSNELLKLRGSAIGIEVRVLASMEVLSFMWSVFTSYSEPKDRSESTGMRFDQLLQLCADCGLHDAIGRVKEPGKLCLHSDLKNGNEAAALAGEIGAFLVCVNLLELLRGGSATTTDCHDRQASPERYCDALQHFVIEFLFPFCRRRGLHEGDNDVATCSLCTNDGRGAPLKFVPPTVSQFLLPRMDDFELIARAHFEFHKSSTIPGLSTGSGVSATELLRQAHDPQAQASAKFGDFLHWLRLSPALINEAVAEMTLHQITTTNAKQQNFQWSTSASEPASQSCVLADYTAILEALMIEGFKTLAHPAFKALYPSDVDKMTVLFDVWGLGDRDIIAHAA